MRERRPRGNNWEKKIPPRFFPSLSLFLSVFLWLLLSSSPLCITASFLTVMSASGARREQRGGGQYFRELECLKYTQRFSSSGWSVQISPVTPFPLGNTHTHTGYPAGIKPACNTASYCGFSNPWQFNSIIIKGAHFFNHHQGIFGVVFCITRLLRTQFLSSQAHWNKESTLTSGV